MRPLFYISGGRMYCLRDGRQTEIPSGVYDGYVRRMKDQIKRNEWKQNGSGAAFLGEIPIASTESRISDTHFQVSCLGFRAGKLLYSLRIDENSGIYSKAKFDDVDEGIVLLDSDYRYFDFDCAANGDLVATAEFAGESHLALLRAGETASTLITEGASFERSPVWSKTEPDVLYFSSAGLSVAEDESENDSRNQRRRYGVPVFGMDAIGMDDRYREHSEEALCRLDLSQGEIVELRKEKGYSFVHPQCDSEGNLYYIRKPYQSSDAPRAGGCLIDLLLMPYRLVCAIVGFFNIFTIKYSGKNLTRSYSDTKAKKKDVEQIFIDGNLISAEKERKANEKRGERYPGIIPRSYELHCLSNDGTDRIVCRGVLAYCLSEDGIIYSNGSYLMQLSNDGGVQKLAAADKVTFLML